MRARHFRLAVVTLATIPTAAALWQCGNSSPASHSDAGLHDGSAGDGMSSSDAAQADDSQPDGMTDAQEAGDGGVATSADADAGDGGADASDGSAETGPDAMPCDEDAGSSACDGGLTCCGGFCVDTTKDPQHCGSCTTACTASQFCTGTACQAALIGNVCHNPKATEALDPYDVDNTAADDMRMALGTVCMPPVSGMIFSETASTVEDQTTGRPLTGVGNTLITGGGSFGQPSVGYMDAKGLTTVYLGQDTANAWYLNRKTGQYVVKTPLTSLTPQHDFLLFEVSVEPESGTLCLSGMGMLHGTPAAGYYFQNVIAPNLSTYTDAWYVYEWTAADDAGTPGPMDTFRLVDHGN